MIFIIFIRRQSFLLRPFIATRYHSILEPCKWLYNLISNLDVCLQIYSLLLCMQSLLLSKSNELLYESIVTVSPWVYTVADNNHSIGDIWHAYSIKKLLVRAKLQRISDVLWPSSLQDGSGVSQEVPWQESECWHLGTPVYKEMKVITLFFWLLKFAVLSFGEVPCIWQ